MHALVWTSSVQYMQVTGSIQMDSFVCRDCFLVDSGATWLQHCFVSWQILGLLHRGRPTFWLCILRFVLSWFLLFALPWKRQRTNQNKNDSINTTQSLKVSIISFCDGTIHYLWITHLLSNSMVIESLNLISEFIWKYNQNKREYVVMWIFLIQKYWSINTRDWYVQIGIRVPYTGFWILYLPVFTEYIIVIYFRLEIKINILVRICDLGAGIQY